MNAWENAIKIWYLCFLRRVEALLHDIECKRVRVYLQNTTGIVIYIFIQRQLKSCIPYTAFVFAGLSGAIHNKTNPNQESSFTCYIEGILPADKNDINLYRVVNGSSDDVTGISRSEITSDGDEHAVSFIVQSVVPGELYACSLKNDTSFEYLKYINASTYSEYKVSHGLCFIA